MSVLYVPAVAADERDLATSLEWLIPLRERGFSAGLMLVPRGGLRLFEAEARERQLRNLERQGGPHHDLRLVVMAPNLPLEEIDFHHRPAESEAAIRRVIDFAAALPWPAIVTFHLNTLLTPVEWEAAGGTPNEKYLRFERLWSDAVAPVLASLGSHARARRIPLKVETTPVPEFGDLPDRPDLNPLGNPFPLYSGRGFVEVRRHGLGIALDLCHTYTLFKAAALLPEPELFDVYKGLFPQDLPRLQEGTLLSEVEALDAGDVLHLNDSRDLYDPRRGRFHQEGVALGDGEIEDLARIVASLRGRDLHAVFEVNETNHDQRPNLRRSLEYFFRHAG